MSSYKRKRSRKPIDIETLKLRMLDALKAIEPVFLGQKGEDYNEDDMKLKLKACHAYSQLASKYRKLVETESNRARIDALEDAIEQRMN